MAAPREIIQCAFIPIGDGDTYDARLGVQKSFEIQEDGIVIFQPVSRLPQEKSDTSNSRKEEGMDTIFVQGKFYSESDENQIIFTSERVRASVYQIYPLAK